MIFEINRLEIAPGNEAGFEQAFAEAARLLLEVKGCRSATLARCVEQPGRYEVRVGWDRLEDHVEHYPATSQAVRIRALLRPLIAGAEPGHFVPLDLATAQA